MERRTVSSVQFFSFSDAPESLKSEWSHAVNEVIQSGRFIGGPFVEKFENNWSTYLGVNYTIGVGNGFDALVLALRALDIKAGDFVAVPIHTFIATWLAVGAVGATPIGIDCDEFGLMDLDILESHKTKFKAVIPVHMHGQMVDMQRLMNWAETKGVKVIEDCAQAHGASKLGKKAGTWGDINAFSFYPTKNLGALGDAGAIVTDNPELAARVKSLSNYGSRPDSKYSYMYSGVNSRLDPIQAAILSINLKFLDEWNQTRIQIANRYSAAFKQLSLKILSSKKNSVYHHFVVLSENRDITRTLLLEKGIYTEIHYPESAEESYLGLTSSKDLKESKASQLALKTLSLPISPWITSDAVDYVIGKVTSDKILRSFFVGM